MSFDVPVLLITWRRPETTRQVLSALRQVSPSVVYVASDGPRNQIEETKVNATRELIDYEIDWPCKISRLLSETNQGCEKGVSEAINWFFSSVEEGIILEDDCVPNVDFFYFCQNLLKRYKDDKRIWCISGNNFQNGQWRGSASYYFSRYNHCWGWATWRNRWDRYSKHRQIWDMISESESFQKTIFEDSVERAYWLAIWNQLFLHSEPDTWDYRWTLVCMANQGLTAIPNKNLVSNIGFQDDATHTFDPSMAVKSEDLKTILHPELVLRDTAADEYTFNGIFGGALLRKQASFMNLVKENALYFARKIKKNIHFLK